MIRDLLRAGQRERVSRWWLAVVAGALIGLAFWLRATTVPYLAAASLATVVALAGLPLSRAERGGVLGVAALAITLLGAGLYQRRLTLVATSWDSYSRQMSAEGITGLRRAVEDETVILGDLAATALRAPADAGAAFGSLESAMGADPPGYRGVMLFDDAVPFAWAGTLRLPVDSLTDSTGVVANGFYVMLYVTRYSQARRVVAASLLHASPPADRLASTLDAATPRGEELRSFGFGGPRPRDATWTVLDAGTRDIATVRPILYSAGEARAHLVEHARLVGAAGLAIAVIFLTGVAWRRPASVTQRLLALVVAVVLVAIIPFNAYSNASVLFDPSVYFAALGGPFTGSLAALAATSGIALLGFFALGRSRMRLRSRWPGLLAVLMIAALGPFLLRDLSRGIALPARGAGVTLWLSWQVALFLAASALLLAGASAGRLALGGSRGMPPVVAPAVAALASVLAPVLWLAPGGWPDWYTALWIAAMGALALARPSRRLLLSVGIVAACGAVTLVWGEVSRRRVDLAQLDVSRLAAPDAPSVELIERFVAELQTEPQPLSREELLSTYVRSPLAAAGHPVELESWQPGESAPSAQLVIADFGRRPDEVRDLVDSARASGRPVSRTQESPQGALTLVAVPHDGGGVTSVVVAPQTLLIPEDPFTQLIGLAPPANTEPPYDVALTTLAAPTPETDQPHWVRKANELHGDWRVPGTTDGSRVHVEVDLRSIDALLPRGALIVLLDLVILSALWTLVAAAGGGLARWARYRVRRWAGSYRARLSLTLFAFFVIPAGIFAFWSYRRLLTTDRDSRVLLVQETLRAITTPGGVDHLDETGDRFDTPLFEYRGGRLLATSDPLYGTLSPLGWYLPRAVAISLGIESEVSATWRPIVGGSSMIIGYRAVAMDNGSRAVLAAPARTNERALDRQRRDIGILVAFFTSLGALAALWLSGVAARELERPVGALRRAALRIARGEALSQLETPPAVEFVPVFSAFERMNADLTASRAALEEAQRRTDSVLRNVASGVLAIDRHGGVMVANPTAEAMLGSPIPPGSSLADAGASALHERTLRFLSNGVDEEGFDLTWKGRQLHGSLTRLVRGAGGAVLTLDDVTDLARAQRVLAWGEMARQVAHEIKNPLTPIRLGVQHLQRSRLDPRVDFDRVFEQNVSRILEEIDRLDEIARAFSRYGVVASERLPSARVDVAAVVRDVVELERIGESEVDWSVDGVDESVLAIATEPELREVMLNLLENARQAHARHVQVMVRLLEAHVDIVVSDDGDGIPEENLARIFEPHFSTRTSGSGLGLAISRGLVAAWGGEMLVTSTPGAGTEMRVTLAAVPD